MKEFLKGTPTYLLLGCFWGLVAGIEMKLGLGSTTATITAMMGAVVSVFLIPFGKKPDNKK